MTDHGELEITLHRRSGDSYTVELRFTPPGSEADVRPIRNDAVVRFDYGRLRALTTDATVYGRHLAGTLFADEETRSAFIRARASAQALGVPLRLRLVLDGAELHELRWETLCDPEDGRALLTGDQVLFSRYLGSSDWRPVRLRPRGNLRALAVIANPTNLNEYQPNQQQLAPIDVEGERTRMRAALGDIPVTELASQGSATLDNLVASLRHDYDIVYLICHGALIDNEPMLWLEDAQGGVSVVPGAELLVRLRELQHCPRLVVLASCQSAAPSNGDALVAIGPQLAEAGVPAVLAMQDSVSMETVARFMPVFFQELQRDGQIDRAMTVARGTVRDRHDAWMPVLFMRLRSGRIWYVPGFGDEKRSFEKWPALIRSITMGRCTPILGPGLLEFLLGSSRETAQRWAETYGFPMESHDRDELPQVAQYLAINQDARFPRDELAAHLRRTILQRFNSELPDNLEQAPLEQLLQAVASQRWSRDHAEPHRVLANLPCPIFVNTNPDPLLIQALQEAGKHPEVAICPWNEYVEQAGSIFDTEPSYRPDAQRPLVYYLFGRLNEPDSVVLTEDDYFDFLIGVTGNKDLIPTVVRRALADSALLFLGFQLDDWNFRVLFRSIMSQQGGGRRNRYAHVAVQINPDEGRILEPERARRYLESYFDQADINIYWGSAEDFARELLERFSQSSNQEGQLPGGTR